MIDTTWRGAISIPSSLIKPFAWFMNHMMDFKPNCSLIKPFAGLISRSSGMFGYTAGTLNRYAKSVLKPDLNVDFTP